MKVFVYTALIALAAAIDLTGPLTNAQVGSETHHSHTAECRCYSAEYRRWLRDEMLDRVDGDFVPCDAVDTCTKDNSDPEWTNSCNATEDLTC